MDRVYWNIVELENIEEEKPTENCDMITQEYKREKIYRIDIDKIPPPPSSGNTVGRLTEGVVRTKISKLDVVENTRKSRKSVENSDKKSVEKFEKSVNVLPIPKKYKSMSVLNIVEGIEENSLILKKSDQELLNVVTKTIVGGGSAQERKFRGGAVGGMLQLSAGNVKSMKTNNDGDDARNEMWQFRQQRIGNVFGNVVTKADAVGDDAVDGMWQSGNNVDSVVVEVAKSGDGAVNGRWQLGNTGDDNNTFGRSVQFGKFVRNEGTSSGDVAKSGRWQFEKSNKFDKDGSVDDAMTDEMGRKGDFLTSLMCTNISLCSSKGRTDMSNVEPVGDDPDEPGLETNVCGAIVADRVKTYVRGPRTGPGAWPSSGPTTCSGRTGTSSSSPSPSPLRRSSTGGVRRTRPTSTPGEGLGTSLFTRKSSAAIHLGISSLISWADGLANEGGGRKSPLKSKLSPPMGMKTLDRSFPICGRGPMREEQVELTRK